MAYITKNILVENQEVGEKTSTFLPGCQVECASIKNLTALLTQVFLFDSCKIVMQSLLVLQISFQQNQRSFMQLQILVVVFQSLQQRELLAMVPVEKKVSILSLVNCPIKTIQLFGKIQQVKRSNLVSSSLPCNWINKVGLMQ